MSAPVPRYRSSPALLVVVLVALAIGAAASLAAGAASTPAFHSGPDSEIVIPVWGLEAAFLVAFAVFLGLVLWTRFGASTAAIPGRMVVMALTLLLVGVLFVVLLQVLGGGGGGFTSSGGGNATSGNNGGTTPPQNSTLGGPGGVLAPLHVPEWTLFVIVAAIALLVAAVAVPGLRRLWEDRDRSGRVRRRASPAEVAEMRGALVTAARALDTGTDARQVIVALYATVLARVAPIVGGVEVDTPEEIRALHLVRLGIRASAATTLTRLFEEARYSTHPMGPDAAERASGAIADALADLDRATVAP